MVSKKICGSYVCSLDKEKSLTSGIRKQQLSTVHVSIKHHFLGNALVGSCIYNLDRQTTVEYFPKCKESKIIEITSSGSECKSA